MRLSKAGSVWNRACRENGGKSTREGDRAFAALLLAHGAIMNGGVGHVFDCLDEEQIESAMEGYRYFGFPEVASLLKSAQRLTEEEKEALTNTYAEFVPTDSLLVLAFEKIFNAAPEQLAPV